MDLTKATDITIGGKSVSQLYLGGRLVWKRNSVEYKWEKIGTAPSSVRGYNLWYDGTNFYDSPGNARSVRYRMDNWSMIAEETTDFPLGMYALDVWTDGTNIYWGSGLSAQMIYDKTNREWRNIIISWIKVTGRHMWRLSDNVMMDSEGLNHYPYNITYQSWGGNWPFQGLRNFSGEDVWAFGNTICYSKGNIQYQLDKSTNTWNAKVWGGTPPTSGRFVFVHNGEAYWADETIVDSTPTYKLNRDTNIWEKITIAGNPHYLPTSVLYIDGETILVSSGYVYKFVVSKK